MAKNSFPMPKTGGGLLPKMVGWVVALAVVVLVVKYPSDSARWATSTFHVLGSAVEGVATFLRLLLS